MKRVILIPHAAVFYYSHAALIKMIWSSNENTDAEMCIYKWDILTSAAVKPSTKSTKELQDFWMSLCLFVSGEYSL